MLATYPVSTTADAGPGSLREAIIDANANPGADDIHFNIGGGGLQTITPIMRYRRSPVQQTLTQRLNQVSPARPWSKFPVPAGNARAASNTAPVARFEGLSLTTSACRVYLTAGAANNVIVGNWIGVDSSGTIARGNGTNGVLQNVLFSKPAAIIASAVHPWLIETLFPAEAPLLMVL